MSEKVRETVSKYDKLLNQEAIVVSGESCEVNDEILGQVGATRDEAFLAIGIHYVQEGATQISSNAAVGGQVVGSTTNTDAAGEHNSLTGVTTYDEDVVMAYAQGSNIGALKELGAHENTHVVTLDNGIPEALSVKALEGWTQWSTWDVIGQQTDVYVDNVNYVKGKVREAGVSEGYALSVFRNKDWDEVRSITNESEDELVLAA